MGSLYIWLTTAAVTAGFSLQEDASGSTYHDMRMADNCVFPFEILLVQDATASFEDLFVRMALDELNVLFTALDDDTLNLDGSEDFTTDISDDVGNNYWGLLSFKDKPIWPLGNSASADNTYKDYCAKVEQNLSRHRQPIIDWYHKTKPQGGGDPPENQFGALYTAAASHEVSWNTDPLATRLIVLITDSPPHYEDDPHVLNITSHQFKKFTGVFNQQRPDEQCVSENYPSAERLAEMLQRRGIKVAFLIHDDSEDQRTMQVWRWFNKDVLKQPDFFLVELARDGAHFAFKMQQIIQSQRIYECGMDNTDEGDDESTEVTEEEEITELDSTDDFVGMAESSREVEMMDEETDCDLLPTARTIIDEESALLRCLRDAELEFVSPTDHKYFAETVPYNLHYRQSSPAAVVFAHEESEVQAAVRCGVAVGVSIVPRSGGHDYSSYSYGQDGDLVIDLKFINHFYLESNGRALIGPGIRAGTLYYKAFHQGKRMFPGGSCTEIAFGGHILGGGYGFYSRAYGLATDLVKSLRMVDHTGEVLIANRTHNQDLYWALCGGGNGNFGIVTEIEADLLDAPEVVTSATLVFEAADFEKVLIGMVNLTQHAPRQLGISLAADPTIIGLQAAYIGPQEEMRSILEPHFSNIANFFSSYRQGDFLTSVGELAITWMLDTKYVVNLPPVADDKTNGTLGRKVHSLSELYLPDDYEPVKTYFKAHSLIWTDQHPFNEEAIKAMTKYYYEAVDSHPTFGIAFEMFGGEESAIRINRYNAWPWRDAHWITHFYSRGLTPLPQADVNFVAQMKRSLRDSGAHAVYANYHDDELQHPLEDYYGGNLNRLKKVKTKYDPHGVFWYPQVIPPHQEPETTEAADIPTTVLTDFVPSLPPTTVISPVLN